ncbi:MAG: hypothetical protein ACYC2U_08245 [Candidatus Amoebophilus sp.]
MVRAKFVVETKDPGDFGNITLSPVYSTDPNHENKKFWDATPAGQIQMWIQNPEAFKHFKLGKEYYVDFTLASMPAAVPK